MRSVRACSHGNQPTNRSSAWVSASPEAATGSPDADGGVYAFGVAGSYGATGNVNQPIIGIAGAPRGGGYWLAARDGSIFSSGTARYAGSTGATHLNQPIVSIATKPEQ